MIVALQTAVANVIIAKAGSPTPYAQAIQAKRAFLPANDLAALSGIHVFIAPSSIVGEIHTRTTESIDAAVDVAVTKKIAAPDRESAAWFDEVAGLISLVDEIAKSIRLGRLGGWTWKQNQITPIYDAVRLRESGVFLSVLRATYWTEE